MTRLASSAEIAQLAESAEAPDVSREELFDVLEKLFVARHNLRNWILRKVNRPKGRPFAMKATVKVKTIDAALERIVCRLEEVP